MYRVRGERSQEVLKVKSLGLRLLGGCWGPVLRWGLLGRVEEENEDFIWAVRCEMVEVDCSDGPGEGPPGTGQQRWVLSLGGTGLANPISRPALESPAQNLAPGRHTSAMLTRQT